MSREKQIEEMARVLLEASRQDNKDKDVHNDYADFNSETIWEYGRDRLNGATALYNEGYRKQSEVEQLQRKYELAVAEREANVKGFTEELSKAKRKVAREIFAEIDKIINKHHSQCYEYEDGDECDTAITYLSYVSVDIDELKEKYTEGET